MKTTHPSQSNKRFLWLILGAASLLLIPLLAMQFTAEVNWSLSDFLIMGILLFALMSGIEFILRKVKSWKIRFLYLGFLVALFLLVWAEMAVGIFNSPIAGS